MKGVHENFEGLADVLDTVQSNRADEAYMHLRNVIAAAFVLGQSSVMSPKMKKIWLSQFQSKGGKSRAKKNQQNSVDWQGPALTFAIEIREKNKALKQDDLAAKILDKWATIDFKGRNPPSVSHGYLVKIISKWERSGKLPTYSHA